jgi:hypothetical protein
MNHQPKYWLLSVLLLWTGSALAQIAAPSLQEIQDRVMIEDLMARYEWALDTGDADAYGALFTEDAVLQSGDRETRGRAAITQEVRDLVARFRAAASTASATGEESAEAKPARKVIHAYANAVIDISGDTATAQSNWIEVWNIRSGAAEVGAAGEYHDRLVKQDGRWYFQHRTLLSTMTVGR